MPKADLFLRPYYVECLCVCLYMPPPMKYGDGYIHPELEQHFIREMYNVNVTAVKLCVLFIDILMLLLFAY